MNGKPSSPVLRGLGASNGARLLDSRPENGVRGDENAATFEETSLPPIGSSCSDEFRIARDPFTISKMSATVTYLALLRVLV
jgi:hypothetical protein